MKIPKYLSILSLAVIGTFCGASPVLATPLLGSDLASFTVLGAATVTNVPTSTIVGSVGVWSSGGANAITGFNSSPGVGAAFFRIDVASTIFMLPAEPVVPGSIGQPLQAPSYG